VGFGDRMLFYERLRLDQGLCLWGFGEMKAFERLVTEESQRRT